MVDLKKEKVEVDCPECGKAMQVSIEAVLAQRTVPCPKCKASIKLVDKNGSVQKTVQKIDKALKDLDASLKKLR